MSARKCNHFSGQTDCSWCRVSAGERDKIAAIMKEHLRVRWLYENNELSGGKITVESIDAAAKAIVDFYLGEP
jgi:hypothetical protein